MALVEARDVETPHIPSDDDSLTNVNDELGVKATILACYQWMEQRLASRGMPRNPEETAREYEQRVVERAAALAEPVRTLTALFQLAGFSTRVMTAPMKELALVSVRAIRADEQ